MDDLVRYDPTDETFVVGGSGYPGGYRIDKDRCDTAEKLLEWLGHLSQKTWFTVEHVDALITCCEQFTKVKRARGC